MEIYRDYCSDVDDSITILVTTTIMPVVTKTNKIKESKVDNMNINNNHDTESINNIINVTRNNKIIIFISILHTFLMITHVGKQMARLEYP